jgi:transposase
MYIRKTVQKAKNGKEYVSYLLTSTYFEGQCVKNPKAERGYSRDRRSDCKQVMLGTVVNRDGFTCAHEVFEGGRQDAKSLNDMLDILEKRTGGLKAARSWWIPG